jgi:nicotinate-nucleotide adenylyltransferase
MNRLLGFYGGTFNPIHQGHLQAALYVHNACGLDQLSLLPCHIPPHREAPLGSEHRLAMVQLAIADYPQLSVDLTELEKSTRSYTVDTLKLLKARFSHDTLCFVIGMDSLQYFTQWHQWQQILTLCHLIVLQRPGYSATEGDAPALLSAYGLHQVDQLRASPAGGILLLDNPLWPVSATAIRSGQQDAQGEIAAVSAYIRQHQLYPR